jgi:hypothetical protein
LLATETECALCQAGLDCEDWRGGSPISISKVNSVLRTLSSCTPSPTHPSRGGGNRQQMSPLATIPFWGGTSSTQGVGVWNPLTWLPNNRLPWFSNYIHLRPLLPLPAGTRGRVGVQSQFHYYSAPPPPHPPPPKPPPVSPVVSGTHGRTYPS